MENKTQDCSYIHNCLIKRRLDDISDALFTIADDGSKMITKLYGYAIVPKEEYENLVSSAQRSAWPVRAGGHMKKQKAITYLVDAVVSWLFIFFHPSYWIMINPYSREWDNELVRLMDNFKFTEINGYHATIGDKRIWIANHPYASFTLFQDTNPFEPKESRPSRRVLYIARKKLLCDFNNNANYVYS